MTARSIMRVGEPAATTAAGNLRSLEMVLAADHGREVRLGAPMPS